MDRFPEDHHLPPEQNEIPSRVSTQHEADRHLSSSKLSSVIEPVVYREREAAAYLAYRFPSVFSVVQRVFEEVRDFIFYMRMDKEGFNSIFGSYRGFFSSLTCFRFLGNDNINFLRVRFSILVQVQRLLLGIF